MADQSEGGVRRWSRGAVVTVAIVAAAGDRSGRGTARQHHGAEAGSAECLLPRRRTDRRHHRSGDLGQELSAAIRRLPAHGRSAAHALRRQRGDAAVADRSRPAFRRRAVPARRRSAAEDDVGGLCLRGGLPRRSAATPTCSRTRPSPSACRHFKQPGTCIHCHASVYVPYKKAGNGDLIKGFEHYNQMPYAEARKDCLAPDFLHRLPRSRHDGPARHAAGFHRRDSRAEGQPGRQGLRREHHGHAAGDAQLSSAASATSSTTSRAPKSG